MDKSSNQPKDQLIRSHSIPASASAIFAILADPARRPDTEPTDWVRCAIDPEPITGTGQVFADIGAGGHQQRLICPVVWGCD